MKHKHVHRFFNGKQKFDLMTSSGPKVEISNIFFSKHTSKTFDDSGGFCRCCCLLLVACCLLVVVFFFQLPNRLRDSIHEPFISMMCVQVWQLSDMSLNDKVQPRKGWGKKHWP